VSDLQITSVTAAVLALIYAVLTFRVGQARGQAGASLGDGSFGVIKRGQEHTVPLLVASRSHANFGEFVPLALILLGLAEHDRAPHFFVLALAVMLVVGRAVHPVGMAGGTLGVLRGIGALLTVVTIVAAAIELLVMAIR
jgi:uncharacterized membrane protein YecN with MAPEG domain